MPTPKYVINPEAEISGAAILSLAASQQLYDFQDFVEKHNFNDVDPSKWYVYTEVMAFLQDLTKRHNTTQNMVSIGMKVFEALPLTGEIQTIEDGLNMMNAMGAMTQRNLSSDAPWYEVIVEDNGNLTFVDRSPLPHDLIYGEVYSLVRRLSPPKTRYIVQREYMNEAEPDSDGAIYRIEKRD